MNRVWIAAALSALALAACDEASSPAPTPGTVVANVFVDEDANGVLSFGDDIPTGLEVALVAVDGGAVVQTVEVGEDGTATFSDVMPGSYRVQLVGEEPEGSTLSGSPAPRAVVPYTGGTVEVDFRFVYFPGSIAGRVYRDDNGDGDYDAGVDRPGAGLKVYLILPLAGGNEALIDSVLTTSQGLYEFPRLAPGEFRLRFQAVGTMSYGEQGATRTVTVPPDTRVTYDVTFTGAPIIPIAEARTQPVGTGVTVRGFVTVLPNVLNFVSSGTTYSELFLQDATGGIVAIEVAGELPALAIGDEVEVSGAVSSNAGQIQIGTTGANAQATVTKLTANSPVTPAPIRFAEIANFERQGQLVVAGPLVYVSSSTPSSTTGAFTATMRKPDGTTLQLRIVHSNTGITVSDFTVGQAYYVTGEMSRFNAAPQIKPRSDADLVPVTVSTVSGARAAAASSRVATTGVVTVAPDVFTSGTNSEIWIQDATGGIAIFGGAATRTAGIAVGDTVDVLGVRSTFNGQAQIGGSATQPLVVIERSSAAPPAPIPQTGAQIVTRGEQEGKLVTTTLTITSVPTGTTAAFTVTASHADGTTGIQIRAAGGNTGLTRSDFVVGQTYQITGILTQFNGTSQIKPRGDADVVAQP